MADEFGDPGVGSVHQTKSWLQYHTACQPLAVSSADHDNPVKGHFLNAHFTDDKSEAQTGGVPVRGWGEHGTANP